jgi:hypothetical protein
VLKGASFDLAPNLRKPLDIVWITIIGITDMQVLQLLSNTGIVFEMLEDRTAASTCNSKPSDINIKT